MATPAASTALPAALPLACKPPAIKPAASASPGPGTPVPATPGPVTPGSITSKEWVIPPRPKPGRKPATDTPPTKRKAQNRAAQRAFRERRAARVGELEDQMKLIEDENEAYLMELRDKVSSLTHEVEQSKREIAWWRDRCHSLEKERRADVGYRNYSVSSSKSSNVPRPVSAEQQMSMSSRSSMQATPQESRHIGEPNNTNGSSDDNDGAGKDELGCHRCSLAHCQCIEDAFNMPGVESLPSNQAESDNKIKQLQVEPQVKAEPEEMEIDFTSRFAGSQPQADESSTISSPAVDPCGFCQDGTPCICAEVAAAQEEEQHNNKRPRRNSTENANRLAPLQNISQFTPPPSDSDARSEVTLPPISQATNLCVSGPGTCGQCQADPKSTLFCKSLAATRLPTASPGCCGGNKGNGGGCCQSGTGSAAKTADRSTVPSRDNTGGTPPLTLSCADTFTTLSRHPKFSRASDEIDTWLPKLHTLPDPKTLSGDSENIRSRPTMEVEAASVMGVLRYFDRRFAE